MVTSVEPMIRIAAPMDNAIFIMSDMIFPRLQISEVRCAVQGHFTNLTKSSNSKRLPKIQQIQRITHTTTSINTLVWTIGQDCYFMNV